MDAGDASSLLVLGRSSEGNDGGRSIMSLIAEHREMWIRYVVVYSDLDGLVQWR